MRINSALEVIIDSHSGYVCISENGEKSSVVPSCGGGCSKTGPSTEGTEGYATHDYRILFSVVCHRPGLSVGEVSINRPPNAMELCARGFWGVEGHPAGVPELLLHIYDVSKYVTIAFLNMLYRSDYY